MRDTLTDPAYWQEFIIDATEGYEDLAEAMQAPGRGPKDVMRIGYGAMREALSATQALYSMGAAVAD